MVVKEMIQAGATNTLLFESARIVSAEYIKKQEGVSFSKPKEGDIPSIHVVRRTLPEAWETTTLALMAFGQKVHTGYDPTNKKGDYESFPSLEGSVMMHIEEPFGEPRFHQGFLGGYLSLGAYKAEVEGIHNHWMISPEVVVDMMRKGRFDEIKDFTGWKYTYNQRVEAFPFIDIEGNPRTVNQIDALLNKLTKEPLSKSAQAVTWDPRWDHNDGTMGAKWEHYDSPCLQRLWFRLVPSDDGKTYTLNLNTHWRSRDHVKAVPQNIYAITEAFFEPTRQRLEEALRVPVRTGRYVDINDSLHLYGHYFDVKLKGLDAEALLEDVFLITSGKGRENRFIMPGTTMHDIYMVEIAKEYQFTKENPDSGRTG